MSEPRILFYDIETAGVNALKADLGFVICFGYKWLGEKKAHCLTISEEDLRAFDDRALLLQASKLMEKADLVVGHYACPAPKERVLMADMTYKAAGDLRVGDRLLAFDEEAPPGRRRSFRPSEVTYAAMSKAPRVRVALSDGTSIDVTPNHPFLVPTGRGNQANWGWVEARNLRVGDTLTRVFPTFEPQFGYEAGFLSAAVDGEGHVGMTSGARLGFSQKQNEMLTQFLSFVSEDYDFKLMGKHNGVYRYILSGIFPVFRFLGTMRPPRLLARGLERIQQLHMHVPREGRTQVVAVQNIGAGQIVNLSTSTRTYILEGFGSHNSVFDRRFIQGRLLIHNLPPIPPTKMRDTCMIARSVGNYSSNRLKYLAKILKLGSQKLENDWPRAWFRVMQGDMEALKGLAHYCKGDVLALEDLYLRLRPFDNPHPRVRKDREGCRVCGAWVQYRGVAVVGEHHYRRLQCTKCGKWDRERKAIKA